MFFARLERRGRGPERGPKARIVRGLTKPRDRPKFGSLPKIWKSAYLDRVGGDGVPGFISWVGYVRPALATGESDVCQRLANWSG